MPKFTLTVTMRQTLVDTHVVEIDAPDLGSAIEAIGLMVGNQEGREGWPALVQAGMAEDDAERLAHLDPHEVSDSEVEIQPGDYTRGMFDVDDTGMKYWKTPGLHPNGAEISEPR